MAITFVGQAGIAGGGHTSPQTISYTSTKGNTLIMSAHLYNLNNGPAVPPVSITDTAGNTWHVSTSTAQTPPTESITDPTDGNNAYMCDFVAWCINAAAVTSVTLAWAGGVNTWTRVVVSEWSNIVQFDNSWAGGSSTSNSSVVTGPVQLNVPGELVIGACDIAGAGTESLPTGWTNLTASGGTDNGYYLPGATTGSYSPVWNSTLAGSWAGTVAVFSPVSGSLLMTGFP